MKITKDMIRENVVFHCNTLEKAIELLQKCHELGYEWKSGNSYLDYNNWKYHEEDTCYYIYNGTYSNINCHKLDEYEIIEYILDKDCEFTKDDLKLGYLVKHRDGDLSMVMPYNTFIALIDKNDSFHYLEEFNNDLSSTSSSNEFDIVKVYGFACFPSEALKFDINDRDLLWERKEEKEKIIEMTLEEVCKELGKEVKIIK